MNYLCKEHSESGEPILPLRTAGGGRRQPRNAVTDVQRWELLSAEIIIYSFPGFLFHLVLSHFENRNVGVAGNDFPLHSWTSEL